MKLVTIYQLPIENDRIFGRFTTEESINFKEYDRVFKGMLDVNSLEDVFYMFNVNHPLGYMGRSLSVSDIVEMDGTKYYCDVWGWKELSF